MLLLQQKFFVGQIPFYRRTSKYWSDKDWTYKQSQGSRKHVIPMKDSKR